MRGTPTTTPSGHTPTTTSSGGRPLSARASGRPPAAAVYGHPMDESKISIVTACLDAFGRKDIDGVMRHVAPDITWHYHVGTRPVVGRDTMGKVLSKLVEHQLDSRWRAIRWAEVGDTLLIEGVEDYLTPEDRRAKVPYMGAYDFDADGLIVGWRDYFDLELLMRSERGEPMEEWVRSLVDAEGT